MNSNERNAARVLVLAELLAISGGCEGCPLRGLHSCQDIVSRKLCWIKKADEIIKRREAVAQYEEAGKRRMGQNAEKRRERKMNEHALNGLDAELEQRQWEIGAIADHLRETRIQCEDERCRNILLLAVTDLLHVDESLMRVRKILEESCPKN